MFGKGKGGGLTALVLTLALIVGAMTIATPQAHAQSVPVAYSYKAFPALTATGLTPANLVVVQEPGGNFAGKNFAFRVKATGAPATCTASLWGAITANPVDADYFKISADVDCNAAADSLNFVVDKNVRAIKGKLTALTGGTSPGVTITVLAAR